MNSKYNNRLINFFQIAGDFALINLSFLLAYYIKFGSLTKLQRAMGHSSLQVSLTYLRGLEVTELKEEDMPMV